MAALLFALLVFGISWPVLLTVATVVPAFSSWLGALPLASVLGMASAGFTLFVALASAALLAAVVYYLIASAEVDEPRLGRACRLGLLVGATAWLLSLITAGLEPATNGMVGASSLASVLGGATVSATPAIVVLVVIATAALLSGIVAYFAEGVALATSGGGSSAKAAAVGSGIHSSPSGAARGTSSLPKQMPAKALASKQASAKTLVSPAQAPSEFVPPKPAASPPKPAASPPPPPSTKAASELPPKPNTSSPKPPPPKSASGLPPKGAGITKSFSSKSTPEQVAILHAQIRKALLANYPYETFMSWDTDKSGKISKQEVPDPNPHLGPISPCLSAPSLALPPCASQLSAAVIDVLGLKVDPAACDSLFDFFDTDGEAGGGTGLLDYQELYRRLANGEGLDNNLLKYSNKAKKQAAKKK